MEGITIPAKDRSQWNELTGKNTCEYHRGYIPIALKCEGLEQNVNLYQYWGDAHKKKQWQKQYCERGGKGCPIRRMILLHKYTNEAEIQNAVRVLKAIGVQYPEDSVDRAVDLCLAMLKGEEE